MRAPEEEADLCVVADWLAANGLQAARFSPAERKTGKTPDFRVYRGDQHVAFCEVKSPRDDWLDDQLAVAEPFQIVGGLRADPTFNRISGHIAKAAKQFDAVNPGRKLPNILVFVNWADANSFQDLHETLTGYLELEGGGRITTMPNVAEGRLIGERKHHIDMYAWLDGRSRRLQGHVFSRTNTAFVAEICSWLGLDMARIRE